MLNQFEENMQTAKFVFQIDKRFTKAISKKEKQNYEYHVMILQIIKLLGSFRVKVKSVLNKLNFIM